jgi:predicted helicase
VFDIKQGVSLFFGIKKTSSDKWAEVYTTDLFGSRKEKFSILDDLHEKLPFKRVYPDDKMALFKDYERNNEDNYLSGIDLSCLFPVHTTGIKNGRDEMACSYIRQEIDDRILALKNCDKKEFNKIWTSLSVGQDPEKIIEDVFDNTGKVALIAYRPFDYRWTYYTGRSGGWSERPREQNIMRSLLQEANSPIGKNIGFVFVRDQPSAYWGDFIGVVDTIVEAKYYSFNRITTLAPLYLNNETLTEDEWTPNFNEDELKKLTQNLSTIPSPIEIFDYIYGVLYDPVYRERFGEFLKRDYPRVPVIAAPEDKDNENAFYVSEEMFAEYVEAGERLRKLHLLQEKDPAELAIIPNTSDDLEIGAVKYKDGVLHLNPKKRITGITQEVWDYCIGGYQVLAKWFKSHKGEKLDIYKFNHIESVVGCLAETIKVQEGLRELHG